MNRILIVEDEPRIVAFLEKGLRANGYTTSVATTLEEGISMASSEYFDLMLLDLNLPGGDGTEVLDWLRGQGDALPVIVLTARNTSKDTINVLDQGANDYMTKPFRFDELLARVRVQLRHKRTAVTDPNASMALSAGEIMLDLRTRKVQIGHTVVELSAREFALAEIFMRHPGQVLSREQLLNHVWGYDYDPGSNVVDVHVKNLRQKLGSELIETVRGVGYRLSV